MFQTAPRYTTTAIAFHWLLALMIIGSFSFGVYMTDLPFSPARVRQYNWHKWAGITILALSMLRLLWRLTHKPPALPTHMPKWQQSASHAAHIALYACFFAVPLAGWAYSSAAGFPVVVYGVLPLPDWVPKSKELADILKLLHKSLAFGLAGIVVIHILAALMHLVRGDDGVFERMLPAGRRKSTY